MGIEAEPGKLVPVVFRRHDGAACEFFARVLTSSEEDRRLGMLMVTSQQRLTALGLTLGGFKPVGRMRGGEAVTDAKLRALHARTVKPTDEELLEAVEELGEAMSRADLWRLLLASIEAAAASEADLGNSDSPSSSTTATCAGSAGGSGGGGDASTSPTSTTPR